MHRDAIFFYPTGLQFAELGSRQSPERGWAEPTRTIKFRRLFADVGRVDEFRRRERVDEAPVDVVHVVVGVDEPETEVGFLLRRIERRFEQTAAHRTRVDGNFR